MGNLIDRQKLLYDIEKHHVSDGKFQHWVQIQQQAQPEQQWIPCSERLPESTGTYITSNEYGEVYCDIWTGCKFICRDKIVAWMPLPEPYMEDET